MKSSFISVQGSSISLYDADTITYEHICAIHSSYGLTWDENKTLYLSTDKSVNTLSLVKKQMNPDAIFNDGKGMHQILFDNNRLYMANTGKNEIVVAKSNKVTHRHKLDPQPGKFPHGGHDTDHLNSVYYYNNKIYICAHNHDKPSFIIITDKDFKKFSFIDDVGEQNHNIHIENNTLYTLSSITGEVVLVDLNTKTQKRIQLDIDKSKFFLRGLARSKDCFYIGLTKMTPERTFRGAVHIIETDHNFNIYDAICPPNAAVGPLREIRIVNERDYAHNEFIFYKEMDLK